MYHFNLDLRRVDRIAGLALPFAAGAAVVFVGLGLYTALWRSPPDYLHGDNVRMMYVHVPAAWIALLLYAVIAACSASFVLARVRAAPILARACIAPGAVSALLCLLTGSLWGRPAWGTWWVWDARLTSMLILFLLYLGLAAVARSDADPERSERVGAYLALLGALDLPIIHFSVEWWNTLHQPSSLLRREGSHIHPDMLQPLLLMGAADLSLAVLAVLLALRTQIARGRSLRRRRRALQREELSP